MASKPNSWYTNQSSSNQSSGAGWYEQKGNSMPWKPSDPVLGTDMTQGEWDQLRALMRKAEDGGKMNELLTVHRKEVKNAPMNRPYPADDDDWKDCEESHAPASPAPVHGQASNSSDGKAPPGALWPEAYTQNSYKVPPMGPPPNLQQAGGNSGIVDAREYHKKWQDRPYDPNDDPWIEEVDKDAKKNDKPVIQLFGNVVQQNADARDAEAKAAAAAEAKAAEAKAAAAAIADIAKRFCDDGSSHSAGFPKFNAQVPLPPNAKADPPVLPVSALGSEREFNEQKGKGKQYDKGGKPDYAKGGKPDYDYAKGGKPDYEKGGKDDKGGKNAAKGEFKGEFKGKEGEKGKQGDKGSGQPAPKTSGSKCARISEEPAEVVEGNSNKMHDAGAMTDGSKRRHEAVESNSDAESASSVMGSFSFISDTGDSPPMFPVVQSGLPPTHKWCDDWVEATIDYEEVDFNVPQPAWIKDTYHWSCTLLKMGRFAEKPITYHDFVVKVFNKSMEECRYAKKMIGQFRKKLTSTPRTQGPDFCAFLIHCRVDAFLNAGYVYQREFAWR